MKWSRIFHRFLWSKYFFDNTQKLKKTTHLKKTQIQWFCETKTLGFLNRFWKSHYYFFKILKISSILKIRYFDILNKFPKILYPYYKTWNLSNFCKTCSFVKILGIHKKMLNLSKPMTIFRSLGPKLQQHEIWSFLRK